MRAGIVYLLTALMLVGTAESGKFSEFELLAHKYFKKFVGFLTDSVQGRHTETLFFESLRGLDLRHTASQSYGTANSFHYKNCAKPDDELVVPSDVTFKPDPLKLPGNVTAGGSVVIKKAIVSPVKLDLDVHYKVLGIWVKVPCIEQIGSCSYNDFCEFVHTDKCPPEIIKAGLDCKCPFPAGNFTVPSATLYINAKIPVSGDVKVQAKASYQNQLVTCAEVELRVK